MKQYREIFKEKRVFNLFIVIFLTMLGIGCGEGEEKEGTDSSERQGTQLMVVSYGGAYQDAQRAAFFEPYGKERGIRLSEGTYGGGYGAFRDSIADGKSGWDVVDVEGNMVLLGGKEGLLEPIDYNVVPKTGLMPEAVNEYGVGVMSFSYLLAWNSDSISADQVAEPWKTFFDPVALPGPRGLHDDPRRTLEIALMADGVSPDQLYPLDLDRAFAFLTRFRDAMKGAGTPIVWWRTYDEPQKLLASGEVMLTPGVDGRLIAARSKGEPIGLSWNGGILDFDWWVVPKGTERREEAMKFIAYAVAATSQAALSEAIAYGPVNEEAWGLLPDSVKREMPTSPENRKGQVRFDTEWWTTNFDSVQTRWEAWRAEGA